MKSLNNTASYLKNEYKNYQFSHNIIAFYYIRSISFYSTTFSHTKHKWNGMEPAFVLLFHHFHFESCHMRYIEIGYPLNLMEWTFWKNLDKRIPPFPITFSHVIKMNTKIINFLMIVLISMKFILFHSISFPIPNFTLDHIWYAEMEWNRFIFPFHFSCGCTFDSCNMRSIRIDFFHNLMKSITLDKLQCSHSTIYFHYIAVVLWKLSQKSSIFIYAFPLILQNLFLCILL